jgi:hypothetical protein
VVGAEVNVKVRTRHGITEKWGHEGKLLQLLRRGVTQEVLYACSRAMKTNYEREKARSLEERAFIGAAVPAFYYCPRSQGAVTLVSSWKVNQLFREVFLGAPK